MQRTGEPAEYFLTFEGCCELLSLNVDQERATRITKIENAWENATMRVASRETNRRRNYLLSCIGLPALMNDRYVLGLISLHEYEEIGGIERPDRQQRTITCPPHCDPGTSVETLHTPICPALV